MRTRSRRPGAVLVLVGVLAAARAHAGSVPPECPDNLPRPLTLALAEQRLAPCNREVRAAAHAMAGAEADRVVAGQRPNPTLSAELGSINPQQGIGAGTPRDKAVESTLRLEQVIERGGKAALRERQADALSSAARADYAEAMRVQRLALRQAYFDVVAAQERTRVQREFVDIAQESMRATEKRFSTGDVARVDADRIRLDAVRTANDLRQAQIDLERARLELAKQVGAEAAAGTIEVRIEWPDAFTKQETATADRPDVAAARLRAAAADAARSLAAAIGTRDVTVGVSASRFPVSEVANTQGYAGINYGLTFSIPLNVRHANEGEVRRAMADLDAAQSTLQRTTAQAAADRRFADADWDAARERLARMESDILPVARAVAQRSEFAYARGATGVLDLLDARRSLKSVELDAMQARADTAKAWARRAAAYETYEARP